MLNTFTFLTIARSRSAVKLIFRRLAQEPLSVPSALKTLGLSTAELRVGDEEEIRLPAFKEEVYPPCTARLKTVDAVRHGWAAELSGSLQSSPLPFPPPQTRQHQATLQARAA